MVTRAKKAIAGFKIRQGMPVGVMVTLRSDRMYAFFESPDQPVPSPNS